MADRENSFPGSDPWARLGRRAGRELDEIRKQLRLARLWDHFIVNAETAVRPEDISRALHDYEPHMIHLSGEGEELGALFLEGPAGEPCPIAPRALADLFESAPSQVHGVLLNACYSEKQARAIGKKVRYVIGMKRGVHEKAAVAFAVGFYQALGNGRSFEQAFRVGCALAGMDSPDASIAPILWKEGKIIRF